MKLQVGEHVGKVELSRPYTNVVLGDDMNCTSNSSVDCFHLMDVTLGVGIPDRVQYLT